MNIDGKNAPPEALMGLAMKQYRTFVQKKVCGAESTEHKETMYLSAQIVTLLNNLKGSNNGGKGSRIGKESKVRLPLEE
jgi:hypothetical protein